MLYTDYKGIKGQVRSKGVDDNVAIYSFSRRFTEDSEVLRRGRHWTSIHTTHAKGKCAISFHLQLKLCEYRHFKYNSLKCPHGFSWHIFILH